MILLLRVGIASGPSNILTGFVKVSGCIGHFRAMLLLYQLHISTCSTSHFQ